MKMSELTKNNPIIELRVGCSVDRSTDNNKSSIRVDIDGYNSFIYRVSYLTSSRFAQQRAYSFIDSICIYPYGHQVSDKNKN